MKLLSILMLSLVSLLQSNHTVELAFVGDAMQHAPQITAAQQADGTYDYSPCFQYLTEDISGADLAVVNLECPLGGKPYTGYPCFSAPDSYAQQLRQVGFDLFLTANNHCLDRRDKGLVRTCHILDSLGIPHIGTYPNQQDREKRIPYIVNVKGMKIAFLDYTYGTNGIPIQGNVIVDFIDQQLIADDIALARQRGAHAICVNLHWGIEYQLKPVSSQRTLADWLVSQGVDLIIGGHPHVVFTAWATSSATRATSTPAAVPWSKSRSGWKTAVPSSPPPDTNSSLSRNPAQAARTTSSSLRPVLTCSAPTMSHNIDVPNEQ